MTLNAGENSFIETSSILMTSLITSIYSFDLPQLKTVTTGWCAFINITSITLTSIITCLYLSDVPFTDGRYIRDSDDCSETFQYIVPSSIHSDSGTCLFLSLPSFSKPQRCNSYSPCNPVIQLFYCFQI